MGHCAFIGGGVTELVLVESGVFTNSDVTAIIPLECQTGDVLVIVDSSSDLFGPVTPGTISGFNQILATVSDGGGSGQHRITSYWRKIEAGDAGTSLAGQGHGGTGKILSWALFRPDDEIDSVSIADAVGTVKANPQIQTAHAGGEPTPIIALGIGSGTPVSTPAEDGRTAGIVLMWSVFNSAPVDVEYTTTGGNWSTLQSFLLKVE